MILPAVEKDEATGPGRPVSVSSRPVLMGWLAHRGRNAAAGLAFQVPHSLPRGGG